MIKLIFSLILIISLFSCSRNVEYNKELWDVKNDGFYYSNREFMLDDLINNYHLKGKHIKELNEIFNNVVVDTFENHYRISFNIVTDYGWNIDPVYTKDLILELNKDSIVKSVEVFEHRN
ncbi:MAG: hypothetical protein V4622_10585 [Bacteroidota bacterium]